MNCHMIFNTNSTTVGRMPLSDLDLLTIPEYPSSSSFYSRIVLLNLQFLSFPLWKLQTLIQQY